MVCAQVVNGGISLSRGETYFKPNLESGQFLWLGVRREIILEHYDKLLKIHFKNATLDSVCAFYNENKKSDTISATICSFYHYFLTPNKLGPISIYTMQSYWNGVKYDTLEAIDTFFVVNPPKIKIIIKKEELKTKKQFEIAAINSVNGKAINSKYKLGWTIYPMLINRDDSILCCLGPFSSFKIHFSNEYSNCKQTKKNQISILNDAKKIRIYVPILDTKYNLIYCPPPLIYEIKKNAL